MAQRICIPDYEYKERIARAAKLIREKGLNVTVFLKISIITLDISQQSML